jgi:UPF0176 protein
MWHITTCYRFRNPHTSTPFDSTAETRKWQQWADEFQLRGLLILGAEGFNTTLAAPNQEQLQTFKSKLIDYYHCPEILFKDSRSEAAPFKQFKIKIRPEIVTLGTPELVPTERHRHLSPEEWHQELATGEGVVIDTRNWYEYRIGTFKNAINPNIEQFSEFPKFMEKQGIQKDQKILIFCTGGIRCEKGILELERQGYHHVYQLEGGILNYLQKFPEGHFEGECFVFDGRLAVDKNLEPTKIYSFCPHCGQPAEIKKQCSYCGREFKICPSCNEISVIQETCSKNCAYHYRRNPQKKMIKKQVITKKNPHV